MPHWWATSRMDHNVLVGGGAARGAFFLGIEADEGDEAVDEGDGEDGEDGGKGVRTLGRGDGAGAGSGNTGEGASRTRSTIQWSKRCWSAVSN